MPGSLIPPGAGRFALLALSVPWLRCYQQTVEAAMLVCEET
jgi:hypothetical protein